MSDEKLLKELQDAIATARAEAANANAAATSANAAADQASAGAAAGVAGARTQSNSETDTDKTVSSGQTYENVDSDVNIVEAWSVNAKRTYDMHQTYDMETQVRNRTHFDTMIVEQQKYLASLNALTISGIANNQNQSNVGNGMLIDRAWNVNETDGFAVLLNKVVGDAVTAAIKKA